MSDKSEIAAMPMSARGRTVTYKDRHGRVQRGRILSIEATWPGYSTAGNRPFIIYTVEHPTYHNHRQYLTSEDVDGVVAMIPTEALEAIIAGTEGCTPGPWARFEGVVGRETHVVGREDECTVVVVPWDRGGSGNAHRDAAHITRLSPEVVRAMATRLLELERLAAWRPIETAPIDEEILVYTPKAIVSRLVLAVGRKAKTTSGSTWIIGGQFAFDVGKPTHWMPLPFHPLTEGATHGR